ncbi:hypothetical protein [Streptomyces bobili]|uniref:hypothetical protein n=1 Tax=Streptomyces bobili TaxID=67280 RepID=UPI003717858E
MTTAPRRSSRLLLLSTVVLAVVGIALLGVPHGQESPATATVTATASHATTDPSSAAATAPAGKPTASTDPSPTSAASTPPSLLESALPPHGEGVAGDRAVQRNLEAAWPADLPAEDERELLTAGRALLRADATGAGRAKWPTIFPDSGVAVAPAFATARFRIQAAIARRDGNSDRAVVHLVWAGMDRGGTFTDLRITDWHFTRTIEKGTATWTPQPRI